MKFFLSIWETLFSFAQTRSAPHVSFPTGSIPGRRYAHWGGGCVRLGAGAGPASIPHVCGHGTYGFGLDPLSVHHALLFGAPAFEFVFDLVWVGGMVPHFKFCTSQFLPFCAHLLMILFLHLPYSHSSPPLIFRPPFPPSSLLSTFSLVSLKFSHSVLFLSVGYSHFCFFSSASSFFSNAPSSSGVGSLLLFMCPLALTFFFGLIFTLTTILSLLLFCSFFGLQCANSGVTCCPRFLAHIYSPFFRQHHRRSRGQSAGRSAVTDFHAYKFEAQRSTNPWHRETNWFMLEFADALTVMKTFLGASNLPIFFSLSFKKK